MLRYTTAGGGRSLETDAVLLCVGWIGNTDGIGLEALGVESSLAPTSRSTSICGRTSPTSTPRGTLTGQVMLVSRVRRMKATSPRLMRSPTPIPRKSRMSWCPQAASPIRNMAQSACASNNAATPAIFAYETSVVGCDELTRAIIDDRTAGFCKLIADREDPQILRCAHRRRTRGGNRAVDGRGNRELS